MRSIPRRGLTTGGINSLLMLSLEQFSPVLPDNYRESSYPVAVYRWHADNPTNKTVTVSVLLSWTNMSGWFRTFTRDFSGNAEPGQP